MGDLRSSGKTVFSCGKGTPSPASGLWPTPTVAGWLTLRRPSLSSPSRAPSPYTCPSSCASFRRWCTHPPRARTRPQDSGLGLDFLRPLSRCCLRGHGTTGLIHAAATSFDDGHSVCDPTSVGPAIGVQDSLALGRVGLKARLYPEALDRRCAPGHATFSFPFEVMGEVWIRKQ